MKFVQILLCCITNISDMFLAQCWRHCSSIGETSSSSFYDFKWQYTKKWPILIVDILLFLIVSYSSFQKNNNNNNKKKPNKNETLGQLVIGYFEQVPKLKITRNLVPILQKVLKICELFVIYSILQYQSWWVNVDQKGFRRRGVDTSLSERQSTQTSGGHGKGNIQYWHFMDN